MKKIFLSLLVAFLVVLMASCACSNSNTHIDENDAHQGNADQHKECEVVFQDFDGSVLKTQIVTKGDDAQPPVGLKREGYKFVKWDTPFEKVMQDIVVKAVYEEIKEPTLIVDTVYAQGEDVAVKVYIKKNPGMLTLLLNTIYIESAMELVKVESGKAMEEYMFTAPKNLSNACNIAWHILDVPKNVMDGEVALLHFKLKEGIAPGAYEISATCNQGAYDAQYEEISFESINGFVIVDPAVKTKEGSE